MTIVADFINRFHNLEGTSLKERKKSLHCFLISVESLTPHLDTLIQNLKPATYLEEIFKIEVLIYFKRSNDLLSILIGGGEIGAFKIIKQKWFVRELIEEYPPIEFVKELFPKFSVSLRTKILRKILMYIEDKSKIQDLFHEIHESYGSQLASILLPGCSSAKISEFLMKNAIYLTSSQLKLLFDKDKYLITIYFEELKNNGKHIDNYKWMSFFKYIGIRDPLFYYETTKKFGIIMHQLGRKSTKKFIDLRKKNILDKPHDYINFLRKDSLVRKFGEDFPELYRKILPKSLSDLKFCISNTLLKYYHKDKQYELYFKTFEEEYKKSLWDNTNYMEERLIEFIPAREERVKWIAKFEKRGNIRKYTAKRKYARYQSKMSFMEDDRKIDIKERKTIFNTLISTCKLTRDYDAFLNILKSFCERHRNSDVTILYNFLRTIYKELDMKKLKEKHWKYIYEIIEIQLFKKQQIFYPIFVEYIKFLYLQNKPIEQYIYILLNEAPLNLSDFEYGIDNFQRTMLQIYIKLLPEIENDDIVIQVALTVIKWNLKHSTDKICISKQQSILHSVMKLRHIKKIDPNAKKVFKYLICRQDGNKEISDLDRTYWENFNNLNDDTITLWFAKHKPAVLKEHLDKVGMMLRANNSILVCTLKKYDHMNIPSIITTLCLEELKNCKPSEREHIIRILVLFMLPEKLLLFFKNYIPERLKTDVIGEYDKQNQHDIQCSLVKYLKLTNNLKNFLPDLLKYCHGDILGSALPSLYSSFCRIPENELYFALEYLNAQAISVRKHSIFLSSLILPVEKVLLKYKQIQTSETNSSVKKHMFFSCYKYFLKNILEECWIIIVQYITNLESDEKKVIKLLINVDKIPKQYRAVFTEQAWKIFAKFKKENVKVDDNMISLLRNLRIRDVITLRDEFCTDVIENNLFDLEKCSVELTVFDFARKYILYGENIEKKIHMIFQVLHNFKKCWLDSGKKLQGLKILNQFCFSLFEDFFGSDKDEINGSFSKLYRDAWTKEFTIEETFEENLMMDFVLLHTESKFLKESFPKQVSKSFSIALRNYGYLITNNFKNFLFRILDFICKGENEELQRINFLNSFLEHECSVEHCILAIELLPPIIYVGDAESEYKNLIAKFLQKDEVVRINLFGKFKTEQY